MLCEASSFSCFNVEKGSRCSSLHVSLNGRSLEWDDDNPGEEPSKKAKDSLHVLWYLSCMKYGT